MGTRARGPPFVPISTIPNDTEGRILINGPSFARARAFSDETPTLRTSPPLFCIFPTFSTRLVFFFSLFFSVVFLLFLSLAFHTMPADYVTTVVMSSMKHYTDAAASTKSKGNRRDRALPVAVIVPETRVSNPFFVRSPPVKLGHRRESRDGVLTNSIDGQDGRPGFKN